MSNKLRFLDCNKKKRQLATTITVGKRIFPHFAPARDPIVQNFTDCIPSALLAIEIIKLDKALQRALTTVPERTSLADDILPPSDDNSKTIVAEKRAPINAQKDVPFIVSKLKDPMPNIIENVAPREAPDDIPSIYGSAKGF